MSLFDLSKELRNGIMNVGNALEQKASRSDVTSRTVAVANLLDQLDDVFIGTDQDNLRNVLDFIDASIEDLAERKKEIESEILNDLIDGEEVHGFELKEGRITRSINQASAITVMKDYVGEESMYDTKMIGIPAMEKLLKEQGLKKSQVDAITSQFITVKTGKPTLARTKV